jgi:hypothetical protein
MNTFYQTWNLKSPVSNKQYILNIPRIVITIYVIYYAQTDFKILVLMRRYNKWYLNFANIINNNKHQYTNYFTNNKNARKYYK